MTDWRREQRCICGKTNTIEQRTDDSGRALIVLHHGDGEARLMLDEGDIRAKGGSVGSCMSNWIHEVHRYERGKREEVA